MPTATGLGKLRPLGELALRNNLVHEVTHRPVHLDSFRAHSAEVAAPGLGWRLKHLVRDSCQHSLVVDISITCKALVEEAERVGSDVIYWSAIHAPTGEQRIGPTAAYLLSKRPCRVIIETQNRPAPRPERVGASA